MAIKQRADFPLPVGAEVGEEGDDPEALAMEKWAEEMVRRGVERRTALQCAAAIWELQRAKDAACAAGTGAVSAVVFAGAAEALPSSNELALVALRMMAIKLYQAPKPRLAAGALILAMGETHRDFTSARQLAEKQHVSHELVANCVEDWQRSAWLPKTIGQKSERAVEAYKQSNGRIK